MRCILCATILFLFQARRIQSECIQETALSGSISGTSSRNDNYLVTKCWKIQVPINSFIHLKLISFVSDKVVCDYAYLHISMERNGENYKYCPDIRNWNPIIALSDVEITFYLEKKIQNSGFQLIYEIKHIECIKTDSFHCTNNTCIPITQVCDGVKDCENGADEMKCKTGITSVEGVDAARIKAIDWLKSKRTAAWGWQENTARAVIALFLGAGANFNGSIPEEELMAKHIELKVAVALLRTKIPLEQLSMFINALLVTCHNPRRFHGNDLVNRLKEYLLSSDNKTHPVAYLALCNADEEWPVKAITDLDNILNSNSEYLFIRDIQAFAVMALACMNNRIQLLNKSENSELSSHYERSIQQFKQYQTSEGSFGNAHTSALITQALFSSGQEHVRDWKLNATIKYLMKELNSSSVDFITTYLSLPVLNGKSFSDISKVNCSLNPRKHGDGDLVLELNEYLGSKIRVQYSLFIGDEKDIIHAISLRIPENFTVFEVMQLAEIEDPKYKFEWKRVSGQMYVYEIANISNDPEAGKFWLMYTGSSNNTQELMHSTSAPDQVLLSDHDHLIMWYKRANF